MSSEFEEEPKMDSVGKDVLGVNFINNNLDEFGRDCIGEILTIIDAIIPERHRQAPSKSLVKQAFWRRVNELKERLSSLANS